MPANQTQRTSLQAPAMRGHSFCYFHAKVHSLGAEPNTKFGNLQLPPPEDPAAIQLSVARIADAVINGRLDLKKANNLLYGLRSHRSSSIARSFSTRLTRSSPRSRMIPRATNSPPTNTSAKIRTTATTAPTPTPAPAVSPPATTRTTRTSPSSLSPSVPSTVSS